MFLLVILRALGSLTTLFLTTKMIGKKQVSELSLFDYVVGISIGNFAADMTMDLENNFFIGVVAVFMFGLTAYIISILTMKSIVLRRFFIGKPTVIIENGKLLEAELRKVKFDINDLLEQCRTQGYFDISVIKYALVEANGQVSILEKGDDSFCANVIIDGNFMEQNIKNSKISKEELVKELKMKGVTEKEVLLATVDENRKVCIYKKSDKVASELLE